MTMNHNYDNMYVQIEPTTLSEVCSENTAFAERLKLRKIESSWKVLLLLIILLSPASLCGPVRTTRGDSQHSRPHSASFQPQQEVLLDWLDATVQQELIANVPFKRSQIPGVGGPSRVPLELSDATGWQQLINNVPEEEPELVLLEEPELVLLEEPVEIFVDAFMSKEAPLESEAPTSDESVFLPAKDPVELVIDAFLSTMDESPNRLPRAAPHWSTPCPNHQRAADPSLSLTKLVEPINISVNRATGHVHQFKDNFAMSAFRDDWEDAVSNNVDAESLKFLCNITVPSEEELLGMDFDQEVVKAYSMMQRCAVGIEQTTLDQALYQSNFLREFRRIESDIVSILCDLHSAMIHRELSPSSPVTKEVMGQEYRDLEQQSERTSRDIAVLKQYLDGLDYLSTVFGHFAT